MTTGVPSWRTNNHTKRTTAPYEADMKPEFPTENFSSPTNVSKSVTNASWPRPQDVMS